MRFAVLALAYTTYVSGCAMTHGTPPAFDAKAADYINQRGTGTIDGHAFFRAETGTVIYAAGEYVRLIPATPYANARFADFYGDGRYRRAGIFDLREDPDPDYAKYMRSTKAESTGRFTFDHVAPGTYYVVTQATWLPDGQIFTQGGVIFEMVTLTGKETEPVKVIVSGK